jgi:hypothetical protein
MPDWIDHETDPKKLNSLRRREVIADAKKACEAQNNVFGILVKRDITSVDQQYPLRLVAGPHPSVPAYHIMEEER